MKITHYTVPSQSLYDADTHLSLEDVDGMDKPTYKMVQIKPSKTYLKGGNMVYPGITGTELYPVAVIVNYSGSPQGADPVQQHTLVSVKEGH